MRAGVALAGAATVVALSATYSVVTAQPTTSVWSGVYSVAQAARGGPIYGNACAECHGPALEGGETAPALAGDDFRWAWHGLSIGDLFERIRISMPEGNPASLSRRDKADVLAYMLEQNDFPAGDTDLRDRTAPLRSIALEAVQP